MSSNRTTKLIRINKAGYDIELKFFWKETRVCFEEKLKSKQTKHIFAHDKLISKTCILGLFRYRYVLTSKLSSNY